MNETAHKTVWLIDPVHSRIRFETKYLLITSVSGWFTQFEGSVKTEEPDFSNSEIELTVYTHSITTGNAERDNHLRSADFFDTQQYPSLLFRSTDVAADDGGVAVQGDLTIKNRTKSLAFTAAYTGMVRDPMGNTKAGFTLQLTLNRKDFDISWNQYFDQAGVLLADEVTIYCDVQLLKIAG